MDCCQCKGIETVFNDKEARNKLREYRKKGPAKTTRMLLEALQGLTRRIDGVTLLDIGGGVGAIHHELLSAGAQKATVVEASTAYVVAAREEAERQGHADRVLYHHANFVDIAPQVPPADIVTLDRVICCYHDMPALVGLSAEKAGMLYGLVYPRSTWWVKAVVSISNLYLWIVRNPMRSYVHNPREVDALVHAKGLQQRFYKTSLMWQVVVYASQGI